ncbi:MAG: T9SS type A sorting domain-containing protein [Saprospiraceae bacterium]
MRWIPTPHSMGTCPNKPGSKEKTLSYLLEYTPNVSGVLTSYTTGFLVSCTPAGSPIVKNQSGIMTSKSREISGCNTMGVVLMNSSGNSGQIVIHAGAPVILHQICLSIPVGESITIQEDVVTDLTTSIDLGNGIYISEFPTFEPVTIGKRQDVPGKPMLLLDFKGIPAGDFLSQLDWSIAQMVNTTQFVIERSTDGVVFAPIGSLDAEGNSGHIQSYQFFDKEAVAGDNYYRLMQVNAQDDREYSPVRIVNFSPKYFSVSYAPNPADEYIEVDINGSKELNTIRLMDGSGRVVLHENIESSMTKFNMDIKKLNAGIYVLEVISGREKFSDKVVIIH